MIEGAGHHAGDLVVVQGEYLQIVEAEEHLVVDLQQLVLGEEKFRDSGGAFERVFFDSRDLVATKVQFHQVGQPAEEAI